MNDASEETRVTLDGALDVSAAKQLRERLSTALDAGCPVVVDASAVDRVDTAALQVLISFSRDAERQEMAVRWADPSDSLCDTAAFLDVSRFLGLPDVPTPVVN